MRFPSPISYVGDKRVKKEKQTKQHIQGHNNSQQEAQRQVMSFLIGLGILFASFVAFFVLQQETVQRTYIYPYHYKEWVEKYSQQYHVDPYLVAAVIKTESKFQHNVQSSHGAIGLMQLMPETAQWIAEQMEEKDFVIQHLAEPEVNIRFGIWYLHILDQEFHGNEVLVLAAYNAGIGNVRHWMETKGWNYDFQDEEDIPYLETREYVRSVLKNQQKYYKLYPPKEVPSN